MAKFLQSDNNLMFEYENDRMIRLQELNAIKPEIERVIASMQVISDKIHELSEYIQSPIELIRDRDGKVSQVKKGSRTAKITRNENGKMVLIGELLRKQEQI